MVGSAVCRRYAREADVQIVTRSRSELNLTDSESVNDFFGTERPDAVCQRFSGCATGVDVEQCTVNDGGHTWPGGTPPLLPGIGDCPFGYQSPSFVASSEIWKFFAAHPSSSVSAAR